MESRFGLTFAVFDRKFVLDRRRERGYSTNPWTTHSHFLISQALLRNEEYAASLRDWLGDFCPGSLLILDEAHHAAPASGARYAIDSDFTRAVRDLAPRFEHRLFLSATPHNGHSNSFAALLEILDPLRFCRGVPVRSARLLDDVMVRRLKEDLRGFAVEVPRREVVQVDVDGLPDDAPELVLAALLDRYRELRERRFEGATRRAQVAASLVVTFLQKRLLSSIEAFASTLRVHRRAIDRQPSRSEAVGRPSLRSWSLPDPAQRSLAPPDADDERAEESEADVQAEEETQVEAVTEAAEAAGAGRASGPAAEELALLDEMTRVAEAARGLPDARVRKLVDWLRANLCPGVPDRPDRPLPPFAPSSGEAACRGVAPNLEPVGGSRGNEGQAGRLPGGTPAREWNHRRVLIFTEYADTKRYLEQQLRTAIAGTDRAEARIGTFHGGMGDASREEIKRAFNDAPDRHPLRILIATDAAREGVNLQNHCADLFHFDVPWNPSRMEQRNGRIDRKLQRAAVVRCHYFVLVQRPEDRVLEALVRKTRTIQQELGSLSTVLDERLAGLLEGGISRHAVDTLTGTIESLDPSSEETAAVREELEGTRERNEKLAAQLEGLSKMLDQSRAYLGLDEAHFRDALSASLEVLGAPPLQPAGAGDGGARWQLPGLDARAGADTSWADTLDTLRAPRRANQKLWEWRKDSPIRPIVFEDPGCIQSDVAHLHLEHRVVQRLLGRFVAQGFVHDDLSRACVAQGQDAVRRVVILGRLSLFGERAARLHDEIFAVAARWIEPARRAGPLEPYAVTAEERTLTLLETALSREGASGVPAPVQATLAGSAERDLAELTPHLRTRGAELASRAETLLGQRGEKEAREMASLLEAQHTRIRRTVETHESEYQVRLFVPQELRQLEADRRHWQRRLDALEEERRSEPDRIRATYRVTARRVEPIGIVYLWPRPEPVA